MHTFSFNKMHLKMSSGMATILSRPQLVNSLRLGNTDITANWFIICSINSSLGVKKILKAMLTHCQLDCRNNLRWYISKNPFFTRKNIGKYGFNMTRKWQCVNSHSTQLPHNLIRTNSCPIHTYGNQSL